MALTQVDGGLIASGAALSNIGAGNITPSYLSTQSQYTGFKNRIINGAMMIDQRNAGASVTPNNSYTLDRWTISNSQTGKLTVQQNAGSVTTPTGFSKYLGITVASAVTIGASDYFELVQPIEGLNVSDLGWGASGAATVTLSFWIRSSLTGTFGGAITNSAANRSYPFTYTISSANTWEQKTITIPGDTTGTWLTTNGVGMFIRFSLGVGSTYSTTAGAWASGTYDSATGATSVVGTNGATFYITGVQLEKGSTATSFDYRPYGTELVLCQRYYEKSYDIGTALGTVTQVGASWTIRTNGTVGTGTYFKVSKRATGATITTYSPATGASGQVRNYQTGTDQASTTSGIGENAFYGGSVSATASDGLAFHWTASAEL